MLPSVVSSWLGASATFARFTLHHLTTFCAQRLARAQHRPITVSNIA
jgi:hypothetical protein